MTVLSEEPRWLEFDKVIRLHEEVTRMSGGMPGVRDENLLRSALDRPRNSWSYAEERGVARLAASYAFSIAKNHAFLDGNKRSASDMRIMFCVYRYGFRLRTAYRRSHRSLPKPRRRNAFRVGVRGFCRDASGDALIRPFDARGHRDGLRRRSTRPAVPNRAEAERLRLRARARGALLSRSRSGRGVRACRRSCAPFCASPM